MNFEHFLLTRFNLGNPDRGWMEWRFNLFEWYCLPSVASQKCRDFTWLVFYDSRTDQDFVERLYSYEAVVPVEVDMTWGSGEKTFLVDRGVELKRLLARKVSDRLRGKPVVLTTRLDNDDAIHETYMQRVQEYSLGIKPTGVILNFSVGYRYELRHRYLYRITDKCNPFQTFVEESEGGRIKTVFDQSHSRVYVDQPELLRQVSKGNLWLEVIHGENYFHSEYTCRCGKPKCDCEPETRPKLTRHFRQRCMGVIPDRVVNEFHFNEPEDVSDTVSFRSELKVLPERVR